MVNSPSRHVIVEGIAENKMEQLNEKAISIEDIFDDLKSKV